MIKGTELRLGNIVIEDGEIKRCFNPYGSFEPIQLTEKWLVRFGFVEKIINIDPYFFIELDFNSDDYPVYNCFLKQLNDQKKVSDSVLLLIEIEYVHQLQNLYFGITGNELELKN